jgi:isopenicillin-N N-acyltransferase like protein
MAQVVGGSGGRRRRLRRVLLGFAVLAVLPPVIHGSIAVATRVLPPPVDLPPPGSTRSWARTSGGLTEVLLQGSPEQIGSAHARLLRRSMVNEETDLLGQFETYVPWWIARLGIEDYSRVRFRHVDRGIPEPRRREVAAEALAFQPDPFASHMQTYQRMTFLHALYDVALPFEHSPLIGCTSFALDSGLSAEGHVLVARTFDFEAGEVLDRDKVVFLVRQDGAIPFASVAWPGFVGVVTGMNAEGVVAVVHGGRAREPEAEGMPVAFSLREVLAHARDTDAAVEILRTQAIMVSHIVFVADSSGHFAAVERAPGMPAYVRETRTGPLSVTNHFEGPLAGDPRNLRVRETTTTLPRRTRVDELIARITPRSATPRTVLEILRDHGCAGDPACRIGDRRAIDALIATHGIVADATDRVLWVSVGPKLSGRFVRVDLGSLLAPDHDPSADGDPETMPEDPILKRGQSLPAPETRP